MLKKAASSTIFESLVWLDLGVNSASRTIDEHSTRLDNGKVRSKIIIIIIIIIIICGDRDKTINHIINECSKLAQNEYKARHDWVGKVIHWEMCRKFQIDHTNRWYMHDSAPVLENKSHKLLRDVNIQRDHQTRPEDHNNQQKKKEENLQNCRLCCPGEPQSKAEDKWKER